jgi:hypothetical protein
MESTTKKILKQSKKDLPAVSVQEGSKCVDGS